MAVMVDTTIPESRPGQGQLAPSRKRLFDPENAVSVNIGRLLLIGSLLAIWEIGASWYFDPIFFSKPSLIAAKFARETFNPDLYHDAFVTGVELLFGYTGGAIVGIVLGVLL